MKIALPPAVQRLERRLSGLERLDQSSSGQTIGQATAAFRAIYDASAKPSHVVVRRIFVRRRRSFDVAGEGDPTPRAKPPARELIRTRGIAFGLYLTLLAIAQLPRAGKTPSPVIRIPVVADVDDDQVSLVNLIAPGTRRGSGLVRHRRLETMRSEQVQNAITFWETLGLAERRTDGYLELLHERGRVEDSDPRKWRMPTPDVSVVPIPVDFFLKGWVHVMTDSELAAWLMFRQWSGITAAATNSQPFSLLGKDRLDWFDQTKDTWDSHDLLARMDLMTSVTSPFKVASGGGTSRRDSNVFTITDDGLGKNALHAARAAVAGVLEEARDRAGL